MCMCLSWRRQETSKPTDVSPRGEQLDHLLMSANTGTKLGSVDDACVTYLGASNPADATPRRCLPFKLSRSTGLNR